MDIGALIGLISAGIILLGTAVGLGYKLFLSLREIIKNKDWGKIITIADKAMIAAEESGKSGADKKAQVIEAVKAGCKEAGVDCDKFLDDLSKYIDECIEFSNSLNSALKIAKKAAKAAK